MAKRKSLEQQKDDSQGTVKQAKTEQTSVSKNVTDITTKYLHLNDKTAVNAKIINPNKPAEEFKQYNYNVLEELIRRTRSIDDILAWSMVDKKLNEIVFKVYDRELLLKLLNRGYSSADHPNLLDKDLIGKLKKLLHCHKKFSLEDIRFIIQNSPPDTIEYAFDQYVAEDVVNRAVELGGYINFVREKLEPLVKAVKENVGFNDILGGVKNFYKFQSPIWMRVIIDLFYLDDLKLTGKNRQYQYEGVRTTENLLLCLSMLSAVEFDINYIVYFYQKFLPGAIHTTKEDEGNPHNKKLLNDLAALVQSHLKKWCANNLPVALQEFTKLKEREKLKAIEKSTQSMDDVTKPKKPPAPKKVAQPIDDLTRAMMRILKQKDKRLNTVELDRVIIELDRTLALYAQSMEGRAVNIKEIISNKTPYGFYLTFFEEKRQAILGKFPGLTRQQLFELSLKTITPIASTGEESSYDESDYSEEENSCDESDYSTSENDNKSDIENNSGPEVQKSTSEEQNISNNNDISAPADTYYQILCRKNNRFLIEWIWEKSLPKVCETMSLQDKIMYTLDQQSDKIKFLGETIVNKPFYLNLFHQHKHWLGYFRKYLTFEEMYELITSQTIYIFINTRISEGWLNYLRQHLTFEQLQNLLTNSDLDVLVNMKHTLSKDWLDYFDKNLTPEQVYELASNHCLQRFIQMSVEWRDYFRQHLTFEQLQKLLTNSSLNILVGMDQKQSAYWLNYFSMNFTPEQVYELASKNYIDIFKIARKSDVWLPFIIDIFKTDRVRFDTYHVLYTLLAYFEKKYSVDPLTVDYYQYIWDEFSRQLPSLLPYLKDLSALNWAHEAFLQAAVKSSSPQFFLKCFISLAEIFCPSAVSHLLPLLKSNQETSTDVFDPLFESPIYDYEKEFTKFNEGEYEESYVYQMMQPANSGVEIIDPESIQQLLNNDVTNENIQYQK